MSTATAKVCLIGDFGVGKTSLARRFVHQDFSERYLTTVGVTIETAEVALAGGRTLKLVVWDIAGSAVIDTVKQNYLRGAAGLLLVADGTRADTLATAVDLERQARDRLGAVPVVYLLNKHDLVDDWALPADAAAGLDAHAGVFLTSARSGANVAAAFHALAAAVAA